MGADFCRKRAKTFIKSWDNSRINLTTIDLFTRLPTLEARTAAFNIMTSDMTLHTGDQLTVEKGEGCLIARQGLRDVARINNPPAEIMQAVETLGIAGGIVQTVYPLAKIAEISLC